MGQIVFILPGFDVWSRQTTHITLIEDRLPRLDRLQLRTHRLQTCRFNDPSVQGGFVAIVLKNVPAAKDQIVKPSQGHKILDERAIMIRALAQTNGAILGQGAYRSSQTFFNQLYTRR